MSLPQVAKTQDWLKRTLQEGSYSPEYQELKFLIHRRLLDRINLEALSSIVGDRARAEVRAVVAKLVEEENPPLNLAEKDRMIEEVLDEVFGLGPLEPLLQDPTVSDILVNTHKQVYIERKGLLELTTVTFRDDAQVMHVIDKIVL